MNESVSPFGSCTVTELYFAGCKKCTYKSESRFTDDCFITKTDACDKCISIDEDIYNPDGAVFWQSGDFCFAESLMQYCYNPDNGEGSCTNYNPGCLGCCLRLNSDVSYCMRAEPDYVTLCNQQSSKYNTEEVNERAESYSAFPLSLSLTITIVTLLLICSRLISIPFVSVPRERFKLLRNGMLTKELKMFWVLYMICSLLLIVQIGVCSSIECGPVSNSATSFLVISLVLMTVFIADSKFEFMKLLKSDPKISPEDSNSKVERGDGVFNPEDTKKTPVPFKK